MPEALKDIANLLINNLGNRLTVTAANPMFSASLSVSSDALHLIPRTGIKYSPYLE
jgi:hypothetical protein